MIALTKAYSTLLFDADDTLLDFQRAERTALSRVLADAGLPNDDAILARYHEINASLWRAFEKDEITKEDIKNERYRRLFQEFGMSPAVSPREINDRYLVQLGDCGFTLPGVPELCRKLKARGYAMHIITNGVPHTQVSRLEKSGLRACFDEIFVSEDLGAQKPLPAFFDAVLNRIDEKDKQKILVIGDALGSDVQGAANAGLDCLWFNSCLAENDRGLPVVREVRSIPELASFFGLQLTGGTLDNRN